jgi:hypothetical protein
MNFIIKQICRISLSRALSIKCNDKIPRSGKEGLSANCMFVAINNNETHRYIVDSITGDILNCRIWNEDRYFDKVDIYK